MMGNYQVRFGGGRMEKGAAGCPSLPTHYGLTNPGASRDLASRPPTFLGLRPKDVMSESHPVPSVEALSKCGHGPHDVGSRAGNPIRPRATEALSKGPRYTGRMAQA